MSLMKKKLGVVDHETKSLVKLQPVGATVSTNYSRKTVQEERQKKKYYFIFKYFGKNVGLQVGFLI